MKTARRNLYIAMLILSLPLLPLARGGSTAGTEKPALGKKELKELLKTAREPADHQRIAEYYRQKAERLTKDSKEHQELAEAYANRTIFEPKTCISGGLLNHCQHFAELQAEAAKEAEALTTLHDGMAKAAEQRQQ